MADLNRDRNLSDMAADRADINTGTAGSMSSVSWGTEDAYWRESYRSRPYFKADRDYEFYRPAYQYGSEATSHYRGRDWNDVEPELERGWDKARGASKSTWQEVKDAVRDAWDRVTGGPDRSPDRR